MVRKTCKVFVHFIWIKSIQIVQVSSNVSFLITYCLHIWYSFILGSQNVDFFGYLGRNNKLAQKLTNFISQRRFYVPQVSINCLACPKGVKYKRISNAQAVVIRNCLSPKKEPQDCKWISWKLHSSFLEFDFLSIFLCFEEWEADFDWIRV